MLNPIINNVINSSTALFATVTAADVTEFKALESTSVLFDTHVILAVASNFTDETVDTISSSFDDSSAVN